MSLEDQKNLSEPRQVVINLDEIATPINLAVAASMRIIATALPALDSLGDRPTPGIPDVPIQFGIQFGEADRKIVHEYSRVWLLSMAFTHLIHGVRHSLEQAYLYSELIKSYPPNAPISVEEWNRICGNAARQANESNFPVLLEKLNRNLTEPLKFSAELQSIQAARNCLEHRRGIVGKKDVSVDTNTLTLLLPRMRLFLRNGDKEVDVEPGLVVQEATRLHYALQARPVEYQLGQQIKLTPRDFLECAQGCQFIGWDLVQKLPRHSSAHKDT